MSRVVIELHQAGLHLTPHRRSARLPACEQRCNISTNTTNSPIHICVWDICASLWPSLQEECQADLEAVQREIASKERELAGVRRQLAELEGREAELGREAEAKTRRQQVGNAKHVETTSAHCAVFVPSQSFSVLHCSF